MIKDRITLVLHKSGDLYDHLIKLINKYQIPYELKTYPEDKVKIQFYHSWVLDYDEFSNTAADYFNETEEPYFFLREGSEIADLEVHGNPKELGVKVFTRVNVQ